MPRRLTDEERAARAAAKRTKLEADLATRKAAAQNAPILKSQFHLAGVTHEGRAAVIDAEAEEDMPVQLIRDTENRHDRNAVAVVLPTGSMIGYVPRDEAAIYAPMIDAGKLCRAWIGDFWTERTYKIPVIGVEFYEPTPENLERFGPLFAEILPAYEKTAHARGAPPVAVLIAIALIVVLAIAMRS